MNDPKSAYEPGTESAEAVDAGEPAVHHRYSNTYNPDAFERPRQGYPVYPQRDPVYGQYRQPPEPPPYGGQAPPRAYAPYDPYQYHPGTGYQQKHASEPPAYEWKLSDYEAYNPQFDQKSPGRKRGHGFVIFAVCLLLTLFAGLASMAALSLMNPQDSVAVSGTPDFPGAGEDAAATPEASAGGGAAPAHLIITDKPQTGGDAPADGRLTIPQVAERVMPSVVSVIIYVNGQFLEPVGIGSGIIFSEDGYIITNAHVVNSGTDFKVHLSNGDPYDAELVGLDADTDLAVIKVNTTGLTPAQFGDSDDLLVGETVVAIGNPVNLDFAGSVTQGIVSALNRQVSPTRYSINYIQTDAAINPGNSGGALANEYGQVIGINVAKIAAAGYEGMGFAIPMSDAQPIIEDLLLHGRVTGRVELGITSYVVDEFEARQFDWRAGVMIQSIEPNSDMIGKDVQRGDIITHINGGRIYEVTDIYAALEDYEVGDSVELSIYRKVSATRSDEFNVTVMLVEDVE